jgi:hypothetical protein
MSETPTPSAPIDYGARWRTIVAAGGTTAYINAQLQAQGVLVERRTAEQLSPRELETYKRDLKREAEARGKLRRECWHAYRATHIVHLGDGVFWSDKTDADKYDTPNGAERRAEHELPALDTPEQLAEAMKLTVRDLRWLAYHRDAATKIHYKRFTIPKRGGGERAIWAPMPKLKAAQHWILRHIVERMPVHGAAHGFLPGRSIGTNAAAHTGAQLVVKMDIKDFFPTVTLRRVKGLFRRVGYPESVGTLLALICTEAPREVVPHDGQTYYIALGPRCLPQGAPTSPALTNTLCQKLDRRLSLMAKRYGWRYTRYADDLTFSLPSGYADDPKIGRLLGRVRRLVADEGFALRPDKTVVARSGGRQAVTGLVVNGTGTPRVPRKLRRQLRAAAHNLSHGKPLKAGESLARLTGYAAYVHMTNPTLGKELLAVFRAEKPPHQA